VTGPAIAGKALGRPARVRPPRRALLALGGDGWRFSRRSSSMDISSLYASVFAVYAVLTLMPDTMPAARRSGDGSRGRA
jgi:hypothetical protein